MAALPALLAARLDNHRLRHAPAAPAADVVRWMGAVQAQDFPGAKWALGLRCPSLVDADVEGALADGTLVRTHVLRPTWHLVAREDVRWMLTLTAPRVRAAATSIERQFGLDARLKSRARTAFARALRDGAHLTRADLARVLGRAKLPAAGTPLALLLIDAELHQVVISGPRRGRDLTYALMDDRVPPTPALDRDEALARLTARYFTSHGPATLQDFAWWSGLTIGDARRGVEACAPSVEERSVEGRRLLGPWPAATTRTQRSAHLLPNFDEYAVAYKDRQGLVHGDARGTEAPMGLLSQSLLVDGQVAGTWSRRPGRGVTRVTVDLKIVPTTPQRRAIAAAVASLAAFLDVPVEWPGLA